MKQENNASGISLDISDELAQGEYSNLAVVMHSSSEFVIDFARMTPNAPNARVKSRVILTPDNAKRLLHLLKDNIDRFEEAMGSIRLPEELPQQDNTAFIHPQAIKGQA